MVLALFDFDGTVTRKDSFLFFLIFSKGFLRLFLISIPLLPVLILYKTNLMSNHFAKELIFSFLFKGMHKDKFNKLSKNFVEYKLDKIINSRAMEKIKWHKTKNHKVVLVSASIENYLFYWCRKNHIELIGTQVELVDSFLTGKFKSKNCYGAEKVSRIKNKYDLKKVKTIYAYGDSKGDYEMIELADFKYLNHF